MAKKTVSFRLPESIVQALEAQVKATGKNKTTLIVEILTQAYGLSQPSAQQVTPEMLQQQLDQLKQQVAVLSINELYTPTEPTIFNCSGFDRQS